MESFCSAQFFFLVFCYFEIYSSWLMRKKRLQNQKKIQLELVLKFKFCYFVIYGIWLWEKKRTEKKIHLKLVLKFKF